MNKYVRTILYPVLALAILILAVLAVSTTEWFHGILRQRVAAQIGRLTGARVDIGQLGFSPFTLQIAMSRVVLHGSEPASGPPLFFAQTFTVRLRPDSIFRREILLSALDVDAATVHVRTQPDGSTNIPGPILSTAAGPATPIQDFMDLSISRMTVNHTNLYLNNARLALDLDAQSVAMQMRRRAARMYQGSLSSNGVRFHTPKLDFPPTTLSSRFEITPAGLNVMELNWRGKGFSGGSTLQVNAAPPLQAQAAFHAAFSAELATKLLRVGAAEAGEVFVTGHAVYENGAWQSQGHVEGRQLLLRSRAFNPGRLEFGTDYSVNSEVLKLPNLQVAALGGRVRARGQVMLRPPQPSVSVHAEIQGVRLRNFLSAFSGSHPMLNSLRWSSAVGGTVDASWRGKWRDLESRMVLQFQAVVNVPGTVVPVDGSLRARLTYDRSVLLDLEALDAKTAASTFHAHGTIQPPQSQLAVDLETSNFEEWRSVVEYLARTSVAIPLKLGSTMTFAGSMTDAGNGPIIQGNLAAGMFYFRGWRWDGLDAKVAIAPNSIQVTAGKLRSQKSLLVVNGTAGLQDWQLDPNGGIRLEAQANQTPLDGLKAALGANYPLSGLATGEAQLRGTPSSPTGGAQVKIEPGVLAGRPFDKLTATLEVAGPIWNVENIQIARGAGNVTGKGTFNPSTRAFSATLRGQAIPLADLAPAGTPGKETLRGFEGKAAFDLDCSGTLDNVALQAHWNIRDLKVMGMPAGNLQGRIGWQNQKLEADGESTGAGGALHFSGTARTEDDWPVEFTGSYSDFVVGPWIRLLLNKKFDSSVSSSGTFKVSGPLRQQDKLLIESRVQTLSVNASDLSWKNAQPLDLRFADGTLRVGRFSIQGPSTNLEAEGSVRFSEPAALSLSAKGQSDAKLLSLLDPAVKATGTSKVDMVINGTPARPLLFGKMEVQDLNLSYGDFPIHLYGMNGEIKLEGERATVQSLRGTSGGGTVTVQGYMSFGTSPVFQVSAKVDQVRLQYPTDFVSQLSGTLRLSGTPDNSRMDGELIIRQLYTTPDFSVLNLLSDVGNSGGTPAIGAASPVASKVRLNVQLFSAPTVHLDAQDLRMVADVDLRLQGTLANPVVVGTIHVLNGETVLRGNRYTINRADISMTNPFRTQPLLDLEATTRVQRYDLTLDVSGPLDRIKIAYRSDPPLPTADILSLLALGYSRQQEQLATTGQEHLSSVGASAILSEALSSQMTGRIQKLFGVSRIKIDPNVGGPENVAGARVTVEQQVTRDLTITYITDTGSSQRRVVQFEWQMSDNVSLFGVRDRNGIFGMELRFRHRLR